MTRDYLEVALTSVLSARNALRDADSSSVGSSEMALEARALVVALQEAKASENPHDTSEFIRRLVDRKRLERMADSVVDLKREPSMPELDSCLLSAYVHLKRALEILGSEQQ